MRPQVPGAPIAAGEVVSLPAEAARAVFRARSPAKLATASLGKPFELDLALPASSKPGTATTSIDLSTPSLRTVR